ncbi:MAG: glycosyltransferase family 4 protein [Chloroflexi bacterium]|nr:glycosyltransferase family 4 protein [Chloroflexota bacterium]
MESTAERILLVLQSTLVGGMETFCVDLARELLERGKDVGVILPEAPTFDPLVGRFREVGARVARCDTDARYGQAHLLRRLVRLSGLLRRWHPDVIHVHTGGATGGLGVLLLGRLVGDATIVATEHDVPSSTPGRLLRVSARARERVRHVLVAVSRRNAALRAERLASNPIHFASILNGIPIPSMSPAERAANRARVRARLDIAPDAIVIGSLVRLVEGKGLDDLLPAFARTRAERLCTLLLVGDGPLRGDLTRLACDLGVAGDVRFAGHQPAPLPYLDAMDIFALAVPAGSMSIALLEAMARGVPPVITFCGPEEAVIHEETGLCAPPHDSAALGEALARLVDDAPLREQLGATAAAHVRRHFSIQRVADDLLELYEAGRCGHVPRRFRADAPPNPRPGDC